MKNRFNRLTSKEWLPFQKSWFRFTNISELYESNIRFFCKAENEGEFVYYYGKNTKVISEVAKRNGEKIETAIDQDNVHLQFAIFDLLDYVTQDCSLQAYIQLKTEIISRLIAIYKQLMHRRFIAVFIRNVEKDGVFYPFAWDLAKEISSIFTLKDEKIGGLAIDGSPNKEFDYFTTDRSAIYCLYFRKDEHSTGIHTPSQIDYFSSNYKQVRKHNFEAEIPSWFVLKPQPRKKDEILHPAKYPEDLVDLFVNSFTESGQNVLDPMSGTGSTQLGAMRNNRNGYGTELSEFFSEIAEQRCTNFIAGLNGAEKPDFKILNIDARKISKSTFGKVHYMLTSPPYWDMLNMKGAENQAKRKEKGLQTNYSDNEHDLGNISDYNKFLNELVSIYSSVIDAIEPGGYATIVVKNIKKKGSNYPLAWDLAARLQEKLILLPEAFWCQDDLSIAPYGYGNTWVSNTFHHYCLNFQKTL